MDIFGIGGNELVIIILLAIIVLGPERLIRSAREIGKFAKSARAYFSTFSDELKAELDILDELEKVKKDLAE